MKNNTKKKSKMILIVSIILGLAIMSYPLVSQLYYDAAIKSTTNEFRQAVTNMESSPEKDENVRLAEAYNEALDPNLNWIDPYSDEERSEGVANYAHMLEVQAQIGIVNIPKINVELPIFAGTNEIILQNGVGHLEGTSLPVGGENTHSVLTAHRGLPEARLFTDLDKMEISDLFCVETIAGEIFYEVDQINVVEPTDIDAVKIEEGQDYVTLLTCTPYMINSHRLLVRGHRVETPDATEMNTKESLWSHIAPYWQYILLILWVIIIVCVFMWRTLK